MSSEDPDQILPETLRRLPVPDGYFTGLEGWFRSPPHDILMFSRQTPQDAMDGGLHLHHRFVLCWCVESPGSITVDGTILTLSPGQGLLIFPFQQHYFSSFQTSEILWAFVSFDLAEHPFLAPLRSTVVEINDGIRTHLGHLARAIQDAGGDVAPHLELLLGDLVGHAERGSHGLPTRGPDQRLQNAVCHVYEHLGQALSVDDVAAKVHLSASHLRRLFRDRMGISLGRFMLQARLNHARSLLHTTDLPVGRISDACGFSSVYAFSRAFSKENGSAPSALRRG